MIGDIIGSVFVIAGVLVIIIAIIGNFRFKYVLNRMHAAALCDTLGLLLVLLGLIIILGFSFQSLKLLAIIVFMWLASPVMSHLIARAEVLTVANLEEECEVMNDDCV